ncbi:hypothetical protein ACTL6U_08645 [Rhodovibrionaceae bacterium A322]
MNSFLLSWSPLVPWPLLAVMGAVALLLICLAWWRRAGWSLLPRALFLTLVLLLLANPSLVQEQRLALPDVALVILDKSPSQGLGERPEQATRALTQLSDQLKLLKNTEVHFYQVEEQAQDLAKGGTQLFATVRKALGEIPRTRLAAVFLISDGQVHDVPADLSGLGIDAPVHLLRSGASAELDRRISTDQAPSFGIVGRPVTFDVLVEDLAGGQARAKAGEQVPVTLSIDGEVKQELLLTTGQAQEVTFTLDHRGPNYIELKTAPLAGELSDVNNLTTLLINGVRDRLKVLLISGEPHPGERSWRNILKSDPAVDLVHFTILRPPEKQDGTPINELSLIAFPTRELFEIKLDEFDLIIFDRYQRRGVLPSIYLENVARYVEQGGALFGALGPAFATPRSLYRTPLSRTLPTVPTGEVVEGGFYPQVTDLGQRHPVTAGLPGSPRLSVEGAAQPLPDWGRWFRQVETDPQSGQVIMKGLNDLPLLILDRKGEGRVAQLTSEQIWLWSRGFEGGGPNAELVRRVAHWLMREPELEEERLTARLDKAHLEVRRYSLDNELPELTLTLPNGETQNLTLQPDRDGQALARVPVRQIGLYRVSDGQNTALTAIGTLNPREYQDLRSSPAALAPLLQASGGGHFFLENSPPWHLRKISGDRRLFGDSWLGVKDLGQQQVTGIEKTSLIPGLLAIVLLLTSLLIAWRKESH